jgi:uncharacterized membrane protein YhaH (DUF805 family)
MMDYQSEVAIAHERLRKRHQQKNIFYIWLTLFTFAVILTIVSVATKTDIYQCTIPMAGIVGLIALLRGIQLYYSSTHREIKDELLEQEMSWLFGENWKETTGYQEYQVAQDRIMRRRAERPLFLLHLLVFIPVNGFIVLFGNMFVQYNEPGAIWFYITALIWLAFLIRHTIVTFPTKGMLRRREHKAGQTLLNEIQRIDKHKPQKAKNDRRYALSDDGELVEIEDDDLWPEPPKPRKKRWL